MLSAFEKKMASLNFLQSFNDFDALFNYVARNSGLANGCCLLVYDFCLRMGHHMPTNMYICLGAREEELRLY